MIPEISRRCRGCGASVRAGASFCPQCGGAMTSEPPVTGRGPVGETPPDYEAAPPPPAGWTPEADVGDAPRWPAPIIVKLDEPEPFARHGGASGGEVAPGGNSSNGPPRAQDVSDLVATGREALPKRRRPVTVVEENLRPRVEKLREASIVMLDEAPNDSGLRFILIGVALFLLFLLFLYVSTFAP